MNTAFFNLRDIAFISIIAILVAMIVNRTISTESK